MAALITVLLVDDDPALLRALVRGLRDPGIEVLTASNADEALSLLRKKPFDVIISDIDMPGRSGLELLNIVRHEHPSVIRMLVTGAATTDRALSAINEGEVARFFVKPFAPKMLRETILSFADRIDRVRRDTVERMERARIDALRGWAERTFPGSTEIARDQDGAMRVDRAAFEAVFRARR
jgi:two-component system, probable response regulator PhcQ